MTDFGARIDLASFICHLATNDLASPELTSLDPSYSQDLFENVVIASDPLITVINMPDSVYGAAYTQLFHERLHYWQLIGYPLFQWRFVFSLELLRYRLSKQGAKAYVVAGLTIGQSVLPKGLLDQIMAFVKIMDAVIHSDHSLSEQQSVEVSAGRCALECGLTSPIPSFPIPQSNILVTCKDGSVVRISLDPIHMFESAVSVTEVIMGARKLPSDEVMFSAENLDYWGCWIYWCEMLSESGISIQRLMYVFLAAIDLAMMGDVGWLLEPDNGEDSQISIQHLQRELLPGLRFVQIAKICSIDLQVILKKAPFDQITGEVGSDPSALYELQALLALACNMSLPLDVAGRDLVRHTQRLGSYLFTPNGPEACTPGQHAVNELRKVPAADWRKAWPICEVVWQEIQERRHDQTMEFIGYKIWSVMKNFSESRCRQPAAHITPALYGEHLRNRFSMPFVNFGGYFFYDRLDFNYDSFASMHVPGPRVAQDIIELLPLLADPPNENSPVCGFIDHGTASCQYAVLGFGCPILGLTPKQESKRQERNLGDFCYRVLSMQKAGILQAS